MILEVNEANFFSTLDDTIKNEQLVLIDFWAPWCTPCKKFSKILDEINIDLDHKIVIFKVNTDINVSLARSYNVLSIPCLILLHNKQVVKRVVGCLSKSEIRQIIDTYIL
ncbi:MAG: thioredoxin [Endomicrobium sp.]|jgi:thioredoxin 1|nr:thioredoxin [Endomicrobium sp.]